MGTPDFAVESLRALVGGGYNVVGVVTTPDKAVGRHTSILQPSAVATFAASVSLPVLKPEKLKDETFLSTLRSWRADIQIVVAFRMLPESVWSMPRFGTINLHASLLPRYRGAAPINHAIMNGETETGVTTFFIEKAIDTGRIIKQRKTEITMTDDAGSVHERLMKLGANLVTETTDMILAGEGYVFSTSQAEYGNGAGELRLAPKIFHETCRIDWRGSALSVYNFVRGLSPYPGAWTDWIEPDGKPGEMKIFETEMIIESHGLLPGTVLTDGRKQLSIAVTDGYLRLLSIQPAGKKRMQTINFLSGRLYSPLWERSNSVT
jgi:methionyl-tRNA formyltransferase